MRLPAHGYNVGCDLCRHTWRVHVRQRSFGIRLLDEYAESGAQQHAVVEFDVFARFEHRFDQRRLIKLRQLVRLSAVPRSLTQVEPRDAALNG